MAYDVELAGRVLGALSAHERVDAKAVEERAMFGGLSYMVGGAMCVGVLGERIVARVNPARRLHRDRNHTPAGRRSTVRHSPVAPAARC